jgi:hypothetical protein
MGIRPIARAPVAFARGVTARTSRIAPDGRYPLRVMGLSAHYVFGLSSPCQSKERSSCQNGQKYTILKGINARSAVIDIITHT